jgi:5-methylcytosine-specific restriction endonuclease McrA
MKHKYGHIKKCLYCSAEFETRPRFVDYCSQKCKNPLNRGEYDPWNKGKQMTEEFKQTKMNLAGLAKGWGWNKGVPNERQREKWLKDNPNKDGKVNNQRPKNPITDPLRKYRSKVRHATYRTLKEMKANGEWIPERGKGSDDWQLDHIIPHKQGFDLGIEPSLLGQRNNIQFIKGKDNRKKWDTYQPLDVVKAITGDKNGL